MIARVAVLICALLLIISGAALWGSRTRWLLSCTLLGTGIFVLIFWPFIAAIINGEVS